GNTTLNGNNITLGVNANGSLVLSDASLGARFAGVDFLNKGTQMAAFSLAMNGGVYQNNATVPPTAIPMTTQGFSVGALRGTRSTGSILTLGITRDIQFGATQNDLTIGVTLTKHAATVLSRVALLEYLYPDHVHPLPQCPP